MFKIIDRYIIKTFFGPFLFIFSILFFIFMISIVWSKLEMFVGKGLSVFQILKLLYYLGMSLITMIVPLTILLASIMTFGGLGERYELVAIKASGGSLLRIMTPLFFVSVGFCFLLFFFSNTLIPDFQRKAENMKSNIRNVKPSLIFTEGEFISTLSDFTLKFDKFLDEDGKNVEGIFIRKKANAYQNQQSIIAKKGKFINTKNINYLKLELYNGYINDEFIGSIRYSERKRQPDQVIKFDTLSYLFDISEFVKKNLDKEEIKNSYKFQNYVTLEKTIEEEKKEHVKNLNSIGNQVLTEANSYIKYISKNPKSKKKIKTNFKLDTLDKSTKNRILFSAYKKLERLKKSSDAHHSEVNYMHKDHSKVVMHQQRMLAFSFTSIIYFLIGASLGSIIRKGGVGLPVVISIIIYIISYTLNLWTENMAWAGQMNPYWATWLPNIVFFPFSIWFSYKATTDSQLFDMEKYKRLLAPIIRLFIKKKEHQRYQ
ncbi:MAG: permease [Flavobacteriales bacterium]|nr:MAG: permease [Flavobacteriales bacterium]